MRDFFCFRNAEEFQQLFGMRYVDGQPVGRNNKILLAFLKSKAVFNYDKNLMGIRSMPMLKDASLNRIAGRGDLWLMNNWFSLSDYWTDDRRGICDDGDEFSVRVVHDYKTVKIRAGKLFRKIILESDFGKVLPEQVVTWLCEEFASEWQVYAQKNSLQNKYELVTGLDGKITFADIYGNGTYNADNLGSCMTGRNRHDFYNKSLSDVFPAALISKEHPNRIVSRCVVYNHVSDADTGEIYRLAERQYSCIGEKGQRLLVDSLKEKGLIDGYKFIGASCHDGTNFVLNDGTSLSNKTLSVHVDFSQNRVLSYQDSFKYYDNREKLAYNRPPENYALNLDTTEGNVRIWYDSYHDRDCFRYVNDVFVDGETMTCASNDMSDFFYWNGFYFHRQKDSQKCPCCGNLMGAHHNDSFFSKITGKKYCCYECMKMDERSAADAKMFFAAFEDTFVAHASELTSAFVWCSDSNWKKGYRKMSIKKETLQALFALNEAIKYKGQVFVGKHWSGVPHGVEKKAKTPTFA